MNVPQDEQLSIHHQPTKRHRVETRHTFSILVALAAGPQTGAKIQSRIIGDTVGDYITVSTLYAALHHLKEKGLLVESHGKQYGLTPAGWHQLQIQTRTSLPLIQ